MSQWLEAFDTFVNNFGYISSMYRTANNCLSLQYQGIGLLLLPSISSEHMVYKNTWRWDIQTQKIKMNIFFLKIRKRTKCLSVYGPFTILVSSVILTFFLFIFLKFIFSYVFNMCKNWQICEQKCMCLRGSGEGVRTIGVAHTYVLIDAGCRKLNSDLLWEESELWHQSHIASLSFAFLHIISLLCFDLFSSQSTYLT